VPTTYVYGGLSDVCDASSAQFVTDHLPGRATIGVLPYAYHHLIIDDPKGCAHVVSAHRQQLLTDST